MSVKRVDSNDEKLNKSEHTNNNNLIVQEESSNTVYARLCSNNSTHETTCETQIVNDNFCSMIYSG